MKRLFQITLANGKPWLLTHTKEGDKYPIPFIHYFDDKQEAKLIKNWINSDDNVDDYLKPARVSIGPDHWRYN